MPRVGETGVGEMGIGETGVGEMGVGETGTNQICMGCFVHVKLLGVGCFVSLRENMWWFSSTYNKMDVGCFVRGVFCPGAGHFV